MCVRNESEAMGLPAVCRVVLTEIWMGEGASEVEREVGSLPEAVGICRCWPSQLRSYKIIDSGTSLWFCSGK